MAVEYVYALHDFVPQNDDEIDFEAGERIEVIEKDDLYGDGLWTGRNLAGRVGLFFKDYTTPAGPVVTDAPTPTATGSFGTSIHPLTEENETNEGVADNGTVMAATMTDIQAAIDQLGQHRNDDGRSMSFESIPACSIPPSPGSLSASSIGRTLALPSVTTLNSYQTAPTPPQPSPTIPESNSGVIYAFPPTPNLVSTAQSGTSSAVGSTFVLPPSGASTTPNSSPSMKKSNHPLEWTIEQVVEWVRSQGFDEYICTKFQEYEITGDVLLEFDVQMLKEIDIPAFGKRMRIANAIQELRQPASMTSSDAVPNRVSLPFPNPSAHSNNSSLSSAALHSVNNPLGYMWMGPSVFQSEFGAIPGSPVSKSRLSLDRLARPGGSQAKEKTEEKGRQQLSFLSTSVDQNRKPAPRDQASESVKRPESINTNNSEGASARLLLSSPNLSDRMKALASINSGDFRPPRPSTTRAKDKDPSVLRKRTNSGLMPESPEPDGAMKYPAPMSVPAAGPSGKADAGRTIKHIGRQDFCNTLGHTLDGLYQSRSLSDSAPWTSPPLSSPTAQPLQGNSALPNQAPPIHRVWLRASEVRRRLLSIIPEESLDGVRRTTVVEEVPEQQQQSPPQPSDPRELSATPRSPISALSHQTDAQHISSAGHALSPPIALQRVSPDYGPIPGGEKIFLVGYGFSEGQDLLVRFGDSTEPVSTKLVNPNILECILPPSHSSRRVVVTLYWEDGPEIQNEGDVLFTYEDIDNEITSSFRRVLNLWRQKSSRLKYNPSVYSFTASSMCRPPVSTESRNILTSEIMGTSIQDEDLSSDSDPGDKFDAIIPILWSSEDRDSVNLVNNLGQNLAHICAQLGHQSLLITVIEKGAHIHAEDMNGRTPLDFARLYRDEDAIDILEGDWDDNIQKVISTGLLPVRLLHRYIPECVLSLQTIKISVGIRKGSGDFAQVRSMSAPVQGALRPDRFPSYNPSDPRMDPLKEHDESDKSDIPIIKFGERSKGVLHQ